MLNITDSSPPSWRLIKYVTECMSAFPIASCEFRTEQSVRIDHFCLLANGDFDEEASALLSSFLRHRQQAQSVQLASHLTFEGKGARRTMTFVPEKVKLSFFCDAVSSLNPPTSLEHTASEAEIEVSQGNSLDVEGLLAHCTLEEEDKLLYALLQKRADADKHIVVKAPNNVSMHWYCLPEQRANSGEETARKLTQNGVASTVRTMLHNVCGTLTAGIAVSFAFYCYIIAIPQEKTQKSKANLNTKMNRLRLF